MEYAGTDALKLTGGGVFRPLREDLQRGEAPLKLERKSYPVVLNNCVARLLTFGKIPYLSVLIRYLPGYSVPDSTLLVCLECLFSQPNGVHETFKAAIGGISGVLWLEKVC